MSFSTTCYSAMGRICRCRNKNKNIFIFSDKEILSRLKQIDNILNGRLFNKEFLKLYNLELENLPNASVLKLSQQNKGAYGKITNDSKTLRSSNQKIEEWKNLRDFVLKHPTISKDKLPEKYNDLYFIFDNKTNGYCYKYGKNHDITDIKFDTREDMSQVSAMDCELPILLNIPYIKQLFESKGYAQIWESKQAVMSPSLYNQIYKGALGEAVGKEILDKYLGWTITEIENYSKYEFFDYIIEERNVYLDFKYWNEFIKDTETCVSKIKGKLNRVQGEKAIIINILKKGEHCSYSNIDGNILQIPYLIDDTSNEISEKMIKIIQDFI